MDTQSFAVSFFGAFYNLVVTYRWRGAAYSESEVEVVTIDWRDGTSQGTQQRLIADKEFLSAVHDALCVQLAEQSDAEPRDEVGPCRSGSYDASKEDE